MAASRSSRVLFHVMLLRPMDVCRLVCVRFVWRQLKSSMSQLEAENAKLKYRITMLERSLHEELAKNSNCKAAAAAAAADPEARARGKSDL